MVQSTYDSISQSDGRLSEVRGNSEDDDDAGLVARGNKSNRINPATMMECAAIAVVLVMVTLASRAPTSTFHDGPSAQINAISSTLLPAQSEGLSISTKQYQEIPSSSLSSRGQSIQMVRDDLPMFATGAADAYHPTQNKDGYLVMLVAENKLMWTEMAAKLEEVVQTGDATILPQWIFNYGDMGGQADFKAAVAKVMQKWIAPPVNPDNLRFQAGAGSVVDCLSWCLANANDGVLVTGPNYPSFVSDFNVHGRVQLHVANTQAVNGYAPTVAELNDCWDKSVAAGNPPKIFIICQPNNPTGLIYSSESMHLMITWALRRGLHVVSDEIYALSVFPGEPMTSAAEIMNQINTGPDDYLGDRVHIVAGMSKDWGMSGFRVGSLFTHNKELLFAMDNIGYYQAVSEYTQFVLTAVFQDDQWVDWYIGENQRRLAATFHALQDAMDLIGVSLFPSTGALFAWADFSSLLLPGQTERELWLELFEDARVAFTTGESCNRDKPGLFRVVYPWPEGGVEAMKELGQRLVKWKSKRG